MDDSRTLLDSEAPHWYDYMILQFVLNAFYPLPGNLGRLTWELQQQPQGQRFKPIQYYFWRPNKERRLYEDSKRVFKTIFKKALATLLLECLHYQV